MLGSTPAPATTQPIGQPQITQTTARENSVEFLVRLQGSLHGCALLNSFLTTGCWASRFASVSALPYTFIVVETWACRMSFCCTPTGAPLSSSQERYVWGGYASLPPNAPRGAEAVNPSHTVHTSACPKHPVVFVLRMASRREKSSMSLCEMSLDWMSVEHTCRKARMPMLKLCSNRPHRPLQNYTELHRSPAVSCSKQRKQRTYPTASADSKSADLRIVGVRPPPGTIESTTYR